MHLLVERSVFLEGDDQVVLKDGVKTYLMAQMLPLNLPTLLLSSHICSLWVCIHDFIFFQFFLAVLPSPHARDLQSRRDPTFRV
jgi:hypothetical protein